MIATLFPSFTTYGKKPAGPCGPAGVWFADDSRLRKRGRREARQEFRAVDEVADNDQFVNALDAQLRRLNSSFWTKNPAMAALLPCAATFLNYPGFI